MRCESRKWFVESKKRVVEAGNRKAKVEVL